MANPANTLQATITYTDSSGNVPINKGIGSPVYNPTATVLGDLTTNQQITGATALNIPGGTAYNVYIKNLAAPGGATLTVQINFGAGLVTLMALQPGSVFLLWQVTNAGGVTGITVTPSAGTIGIEYFLGA